MDLVDLASRVGPILGFVVCITVVAELADGLGARHLQLGGPHHGPVERAAEAFAGLCDRAAERGVLVSLEYLPEMTNVESSAQALAIDCSVTAL